MNRVIYSFFLLAALFFISSCKSGEEEKYSVEKVTDSKGYTYETVSNDPLGVRIYTLKNGLKVYLTVNKDEPRIQTVIGVKAGAKNDPRNTTGLAHYLEHMMFKGTDEIGTMDYEKEEVLLNQISDLFEKRMQTSDSIEKKTIYKQIDSLSLLASQYALSNEYDKLSAIIGASGTNAFTSYDQTAYINDIPSNEIERWLKTESERFNTLVLRLFHTELETVYEEFNISQDNDNRKVNEAVMMGLFINHPYNTSVLGKGEHLKNPSMINIQNFFKTYYVPNNMAIIMSGDLDYDKTIQLIDKYWGGISPNEKIPAFTYEPEKPIAKTFEKEVLGPQPEFISIGFRTGGLNSKESYLAKITSAILNNSQAGLIDLNLVQKQKVLSAYCYPSLLKDYGIFILGGRPKQDQTLEEVKNLLMAELEKVKKGQFEDWILTAINNDFRLTEIRRNETNGRAFSLLSSFINDIERVDALKELDEMAKIKKEDIVKFANETFKDNSVIVYKRIGTDPCVMKVSKPPISGVNINRQEESAFIKNFKTISSEKMEPVFVNYTEKIQNDQIKKDVNLNYIKNITNELFELNYILDMGSYHNKKLALAIGYLDYIGTSKYSPEDLRKEFYKLGLELGVSSSGERCYVYVNGLDKSFDKGIELLEHVISEAKADETIYNDYIARILKSRQDAKLNKGTILNSAMLSYGMYGQKSPFTDILQEDELKSINSNELVDIIKSLTSYKHQIFYYGPRELDNVKTLLTQYHKTKDPLNDYPSPVEYPEQDMTEHTVYFVHYDMVQSNIMVIQKDQLFDKTLLPAMNLYNEFYGSGMSSIFFQELREAKGLAYTAFSYYSIPQKAKYSHYINSFIGTQPDKIDLALTTIFSLLNKMPEAVEQFNSSKDNILKNIETSRITKSDIFWTFLQNKELGMDYDYRQDVYNNVKNMTIQDIEEFFNNHVKGKNYTILVLGNRAMVDKKILAKFGKVKELTLEEIFNY